VLQNQRELLKDLEPRESRFEVVAPNDNPDLVWDPITLDVLAGADVIAHQIKLSDLPGAIDRLAAVNGFKRLAAKAPQTLRVLPDDKVHPRDSRIEVQISGVAQRSRREHTANPKPRSRGRRSLTAFRNRPVGSRVHRPGCPG